jgi:hypothetical protein
MVYSTQNHWDYGLCPSSGILHNQKHNVSDTGSVSFIMLSLVLSEGTNSTLFLHLKAEADPISEMKCFQRGND